MGLSWKCVLNCVHTAIVSSGNFNCTKAPQCAMALYCSIKSKWNESILHFAFHRAPSPLPRWARAECLFWAPAQTNCTNYCCRCLSLSFYSFTFAWSSAFARQLIDRNKCTRTTWANIHVHRVYYTMFIVIVYASIGCTHDITSSHTSTPSTVFVLIDVFPSLFAFQLNEIVYMQSKTKLFIIIALHA